MLPAFAERADRALRHVAAENLNERDKDSFSLDGTVPTTSLLAT